MSRDEPIPPRLTVLLAREAKTGVIFRRGPSELVGVYGWNRKTDEVREAQWFQGRIDVDRSDLSPDGRHMIYFASKNGEPWTAVSRAPYIKALDFMPQDDHHGGGGHFVDNRTYVHDPSPFLPGGTNEEMLPADYVAPANRFRSGLTRIVRALPSGQHQNDFYPKFSRDGWDAMGTWKGAYPHARHTWERPFVRGWRLRRNINAVAKPRRGKGVHYATHALVPREGEVVERLDWEWADIADDRLFWCANGCLLRGSVEAALGEREPKLIHDFRGDRFKPLEAPY